jgi:hypothetical protein
MPAILATQAIDSRRIAVQASSGKQFSRPTSPKNTSHTKKNCWNGSWYRPTSNPSTINK